MSIRVSPQLNLNGTAEKAIKLYESALGAKTENLMRLGEMPGSKASPEHKNRIIHSSLRIGEDIVMVSDSMPDSPVPAESNVQVCLNFDDIADMTSKFNKLASAGKVTMPLDDTFWGAKFGMLTDAFGIQWMFNCPHKA